MCKCAGKIMDSIIIAIQLLICIIKAQGSNPCTGFETVLIFTILRLNSLTYAHWISHPEDNQSATLLL